MRLRPQCCATLLRAWHEVLPQSGNHVNKPLPPPAQAGGVAPLAALLQQWAAAAPQGSAPPFGHATLAYLLQVTANLAELPACRQQLAAAGVGGSIKAAAVACAGGASGGEREHVAVAGRAATDALRTLGFGHWPQ